MQVGWHEPTTPVGIDWEVMMFLDIRRGIEALHCSDSIRSWHFQSGGLQSLHCSDPVRRWGELNRYTVAIQCPHWIHRHLDIGRGRTKSEMGGIESLHCSESLPPMNLQAFGHWKGAIQVGGGELNRYTVAIQCPPNEVTGIWTLKRGFQSRRWGELNRYTVAIQCPHWICRVLAYGGGPWSLERGN